jgi:hypothetical protein
VEMSTPHCGVLSAASGPIAISLNAKLLLSAMQCGTIALGGEYRQTAAERNRQWSQSSPSARL